MAGKLPPLFVISPDDHAGYIAVASYTFLVLMLCLVATRIFTRWYIVRFFRVDDALLAFAALVALVQSILIQYAIDHGLGRRRATVSPSDFLAYQKYEYASQILLIISIAVAKVSLSYLLQSLMSDKHTLIGSRTLLAFIVAWALASVLALAFQCPLPSPWVDSAQCVNQTALRYAIGVVDITTDVALIILPCVVFWSVKDRVRRLRVAALFSIRIAAIVVTAVQLSYVRALFEEDADKTWESIPATIWAQIMMNISIGCTALPSLGRLIVEMRPEVNAFAGTRIIDSSKSPADRYILNSFGHRFNRDYVLSNNLGVETSVRSAHTDHDDSESIIGLREDGLRQDVIQQTVAIEVKYAADLS